VTKVLMKGNEAIAESAIRAGCRYFFGYPITPQNEIPEYLSKAMPEAGGVFLQAESEIAAINMCFGVATTGSRVMTSSSSPGISLKQEGISYMAGARLPCVIVNIQRAGPGLGGILSAQGDYFQATRGGGNGDYRTVVYAPSTVQEAADLMFDAFDTADKYRIPVMVLGDGMLGQMMEPVELRDPLPAGPSGEDWTLGGTGNIRKPRKIHSLNVNPIMLERHIQLLANIYEEITVNETRAEYHGLECADVVVVAYGTTARIVREAIDLCKGYDIKVGMIRPVTLWPYPEKIFDLIGKNCKGVLCVELSLGQMIDDVKISVRGRQEVFFHGRTGGMIPAAQDIANEIKRIACERE
jgi:2-oxoglutarate/2-oxoacid ferredoxin oxidoreductase subunit alpha